MSVLYLNTEFVSQSNVTTGHVGIFHQSCIDYILILLKMENVYEQKQGNNNTFRAANNFF